jgi:ribosomal protein L2
VTDDGRVVARSARERTTGAFVFCGKKATLAVGNVLPLAALPEGTIVCNVEEKRETDAGAARVVVVTDDGRVVARSARERTTVTGLRRGEGR